MKIYHNLSSYLVHGQTNSRTDSQTNKRKTQTGENISWSLWPKKIGGLLFDKRWMDVPLDWPTNW